MDKITVSQEYLKTFLKDHHFINAALAKKMGVSEDIVSGCFNHKPNHHGKPLSFSRKNIELLNQALQQIADDLSGCKLEASDDEFATKSFINDDPAVIESLRRIGEYIRLRGLTNKVLGWNAKRCLNNISVNGPKPHVHISKEDAMRISVEIMSIAVTLAGYEVVFDGEEPDNNKGTRVESSPSVGPGVNAWDDTTLDLWDRYAAFHRLFPDGLIAFAVNDGFTVCEDDARLLARIDTTLQPYTAPFQGHVTLYMDADKWKQMRRAWDDGDEMVVETPMYPAE